MSGYLFHCILYLLLGDDNGIQEMERRQIQCNLWPLIITGISIFVVITGSVVRLANERNYVKDGLITVEGLLEVYNYGEWGNVCDDEFSNLSATVVCKMLGLNTWSGTAIPSMGGGVHAIKMDDVKCSGSERSIFKCSHQGWGMHNCEHKEDVGVRCTNRWIISLSGGTSGFLQLEFGGGIFNVCSKNVRPNVSFAVCLSLGLTNDGSYDVIKYPGTDVIDDFNCKDNMDPKTCTYNSISNQPCDSGLVLVKCSQLQLVDSEDRKSGRVLIGHEKEWGSICDDGFSRTQASVVCRELGMSWNGKFSGEFKASSRPQYLLDNVVCTGSESNIVSCDHSRWKTHNCDMEHREDVGVECLKENMDLQLSSGFTTYEGIAQIFLGADYVNICRDFFDVEDALVFCRELRGSCRSAAVVNGRSYQTQVNRTYQEFFNCKGNESRLIDCPRYSHSCRAENFVAVVCDPTMASLEIDVPTPLTVNVTVNLTCSSLGGVPAPRIWWDCCDYPNATGTLSHRYNSTVSVLEIIPKIDCNWENCTCYLHQEETEHPIISETRKLEIYFPVLEDFSLEIPTLIEYVSTNITCTSSSGNPLPNLRWSCDNIIADNASSEITSSTSHTILTFHPNRSFHGDNCTCIGWQENTTFYTTSKSVKLNILYAVLDVYVTSTLLKQNEMGYVICRASPGNPKPVLQWSCNNTTIATIETEADNTVMSIMYFRFSTEHNGMNCTCIVSQKGGFFESRSKSIVLRTH